MAGSWSSRTGQLTESFILSNKRCHIGWLSGISFAARKLFRARRSQLARIERESQLLVGLNAFKHGPFARVCVDCEHSRRMSILGTMGPRQFGGLLARDPGHRDGSANFVARYFWSCATGQHEHYGKGEQ